jgi:hypothetical protein
MHNSSRPKEHMLGREGRNGEKSTFVIRSIRQECPSTHSRAFAISSNSSLTLIHSYSIAVVRRPRSLLAFFHPYTFREQQHQPAFNDDRNSLPPSIAPSSVDNNRALSAGMNSQCEWAILAAHLLTLL